MKRDSDFLNLIDAHRLGILPIISFDSHGRIGMISSNGIAAEDRSSVDVLPLIHSRRYDQFNDSVIGTITLTER
jgi:hypothetical protein